MRPKSSGTPIGQSIGAETPAEIAVCIVAELIAVRAEKKVNDITPGHNQR